MHAIDLLVQQHEEASGLLDQVRDAGGEDRVRLLRRLSEVLTLHAVLEEEHFYPLIRRAGFPEAVDESLREHAEVKDTLGQLLSGRLQDLELELMLQRLELAVRDHVDKEESELFPWANARIEDEDLRTAGEAMARTCADVRERERMRAAAQRESHAER